MLPPHYVVFNKSTSVFLCEDGGKHPRYHFDWSQDSHSIAVTGIPVRHYDNFAPTTRGREEILCAYVLHQTDISLGRLPGFRALSSCFVLIVATNGPFVKQKLPGVYKRKKRKKTLPNYTFWQNDFLINMSKPIEGKPTWHCRGMQANG